MNFEYNPNYGDCARMPYLNSWAGRYKYFTPWEGTKNFFPLRLRRAGKKFVPSRGVKYFIPPLPTVEVRYMQFNVF